MPGRPAGSPPRLIHAAYPAWPYSFERHVVPALGYAKRHALDVYLRVLDADEIHQNKKARLSRANQYFELARVRHHRLEAEALFCRDVFFATTIGYLLRLRGTRLVGALQFERNVIRVYVLAEINIVVAKPPRERGLTRPIRPGNHQQKRLIQDSRAVSESGNERLRRISIVVFGFTARFRAFRNMSRQLGKLLCLGGQGLELLARMGSPQIHRLR